MTQPEYVPLSLGDKVRRTETLPPAGPWLPVRPGDLVGPDRPSGGMFGTPGPDSGYGLKLAKTVIAGLRLPADEDHDDALAGLFAVGTKRSSIFGRAPIIHDFQLAAILLGFWVGAPAGLVEMRKQLLAGAGHDYTHAREVAAKIPEATLRMKPESVPERLANDWRSLFNA